MNDLLNASWSPTIDEYCWNKSFGLCVIREHIENDLYRAYFPFTHQTLPVSQLEPFIGELPTFI